MKIFLKIITKLFFKLNQFKNCFSFCENIKFYMYSNKNLQNIMYEKDMIYNN